MSTVSKVAAVLGTGLLSSALTYLALKHDTTERPVGREEASSAEKAAAAAQKEGKWLPRLETKNNLPLNLNTLSSKLAIDKIDWDGKRVLVRVDYNVPLKNGKVTDTRRIEETIDTLKLLLSKKGPKGGAKAIVLIAHLGQPSGQFRREDFSLAPCVPVLESLLKVPVRFLPDCVGPEVEKAIDDCDKPGTIFLLENLRFHPEEIGTIDDGKGQKLKVPQDKIDAFQQSLSRLGDMFVFEAFGAAHRPHSSINGIRIPIRVAGLLMQKELTYYAQVLGAPKRPFVAVLGGAKVSDKIMVIENLLELVDELIIGGGMAYTFKKLVDKVDIGNSLFDEPGAKAVERILKKAKSRQVRLHFPIDHVIADKFSEHARIGITDDATGVPSGWLALDIGPRSRALFSEVCGRAKTILWNGPMGVFEKGPFAAGTLSVMCDLVVATKRGAVTIIGGGDTGAASSTFYFGRDSCAAQVSHVSTGGGSSLVLMEGKMLPGVQILSNRELTDEAPSPRAVGSAASREKEEKSKAAASS